MKMIYFPKRLSSSSAHFQISKEYIQHVTLKQTINLTNKRCLDLNSTPFNSFHQSIFVKLWGRKTSFWGLVAPQRDKNEDTTKIISLNEKTCLKEQAKFDSNLINLLIKLVLIDLQQLDDQFKCKLLLQKI